MNKFHEIRPVVLGLAIKDRKLLVSGWKYLYI